MHDGWEDFEKVRDRVRALTGYTRVSPITRGFSPECKFLIVGGDGSWYLVRTTRTPDPSDTEKKRVEFHILRDLRQFSPLVPDTFGFGTSDDGTVCFMVLSFFEGSDGEEVLGTFSGPEQYSLGVRAGEELRRLHAMPAPPATPEWHDAFLAKAERKMGSVSRMGIELPGGDARNLREYIHGNMSCIRRMRQTFLHDDYHPANLIIHDGSLSGIIDFNRYDWGDPVHDFVKVAFFSRALSIPFSAGQIDGYCAGTPPPGFWKRYSLYCAVTLFSDLLWAHQYEERTGLDGEVERSKIRVRRVLSDHEGFSGDVPGWYRDYERPRGFLSRRQ